MYSFSGSSGRRGRVSAASKTCCWSHAKSAGFAQTPSTVVTEGTKFIVRASLSVVALGEPSFLDGTVYCGKPSRVYQWFDSLARIAGVVNDIFFLLKFLGVCPVVPARDKLLEVINRFAAHPEATV